MPTISGVAVLNGHSILEDSRIRLRCPCEPDYLQQILRLSQ